MPGEVEAFETACMGVGERTGMADGAGFRDWAPEDLARTKARIAEHLRRLDGILPE